MTRHLITFGGAAFDRTTRITVDACRAQGIACHVYDDRWLTKQPFYSTNLWIFQRQPQHGFGFCSWKPYIIQHALSRMEVGDTMLYLDADTYPIADLSLLFELAEREGVVLFEEQGCVNRTWIRRECFEAMEATEARYLDAIIACGRFQLFQKINDRWIDHLLNSWQRYSLDKRCQFHEGSPGGFDDPTFRRSSCEQAVLSILAQRFYLPLHRTPDQGGWPVAHNGTYKPDDRYPQLFIQDGARGNLRDWSGSRFANVR